MEFRGSYRIHLEIKTTEVLIAALCVPTVDSDSGYTYQKSLATRKPEGFPFSTKAEYDVRPAPKQNDTPFNNIQSGLER